LFTAHELIRTKLNWPEQVDPVYMMRSLVTCVIRVTLVDGLHTYLLITRLVLITTHVSQCGCSHWSSRMEFSSVQFSLCAVNKLLFASLVIAYFYLCVYVAFAAPCRPYECVLTAWFVDYSSLLCKEMLQIMSKSNSTFI